MAPRAIRKALGAVKDQTTIGIAKVAGSSVPELEVAVVKATSHEEVPVDDKYVHELLYLTSYSRGYVNACLGLLARRLGKTRNWVVAIKTLMVTHRLLREGDPTFEEELARMGRRMLMLSAFTDESRSNGWDYTAFVRTYALYLDERLDCHVFSPGQAPKRERGGYDGGGYRNEEYRYSDSRDYYDDRRRESPPRQTTGQLKTKDMKPDMLLEKLPVMQRIMERMLACRPAGAARYHRLTQICLYMIIKESFQLYGEIRDGITVLLEAFFDMEYQESTKAFDIYAKSAKQSEELDSFYNVCKHIGVGRSSDYPTIVKVAQDHLDTLEDSLRERSRSGSRAQRPKSPEPSPPPKAEESEPEDIDYNGIKALPAPPVEPPAPEPEPQVEEKDADLLNLDKSTMVAEGDRLALALFSDAPSANGKWEPFGSSTPQANGGSAASYSENGKAGWELALVTEASNLAKTPTTSLAGNFDQLLLDSMYEQGSVAQKAVSSMPAGSASSVAIPGKPTNYLALPAPSGTVDEDPFSASLGVPPPPFVQMADMQQKQRLLTQEQQLWNQYQQNGMQGQYGYTSYYGNGHPQYGHYSYGMGMGGASYGYGYNY
ncbi:putative clathrin assembly protein At2g25430 [Selaginella moellendorffii]|uniref:putative clathrin assembly protein At2g25430 n=1 Tax=Selaginella moellendorffii TaxID=88036 RepID=UPI000D1D01C1|nr:putative clathrin assembly protein At2g25430 [Selaginella moellendorffii]|eukprot:XP_024544128.1 putative clathrin assembly protein At2g25430 [Selaginella moellendorffii]